MHTERPAATATVERATGRPVTTVPTRLHRMLCPDRLAPLTACGFRIVHPTNARYRPRRGPSVLRGVSSTTTHRAVSFGSLR
jgi:hypothetical protein